MYDPAVCTHCRGRMGWAVRGMCMMCAWGVCVACVWCVQGVCGMCVVCVGGVRRSVHCVQGTQTHVRCFLTLP